MRDYYVYILANERKTIYVGITNNLERRIWEHRNRTTPGFASEHGCDKIVHIKAFPYVNDAIAREKQIKGWRRSKKIALIEGKNPE